MNKRLFIFLPLTLTLLVFPSCNSDNTIILDTPLPVPLLEPEKVTGWAKKTSCVIGMNNVNQTTLSENRYDNKKRLKEETNAIINFKSDKFTTENERVRYEYNKNGLETLKEMYTFDGLGRPNKTVSHIQEYDKHNNVIKDVTISYNYNKSDSIHSDIINSTYTYNKNRKVTSVVKLTYHDNDLKNKKVTTYSYDNKQRLIVEGTMTWDDRFDDPFGYDELLTDRYAYKGMKETRTRIKINNANTLKSTTNKSSLIIEYNKNKKPINYVGYDYFPNSDIVEHETKINYTYNAQGLETSQTMYRSSFDSTTTTVTCINTSYCGKNNDKIKSYTSFVVQVHDLNGSTENDKIEFKGVYNEYDNSERVIKQEISTTSNAMYPTEITTNTFSY